MNDQPTSTPDGDEARRKRLVARGWHPVTGTLFRRELWRSPGGRVLGEEEAFAELAREEKKERAEKET